MNRRAVVLGLATVAVATQANARGMYCTRHRRACEERREREAVQKERERKRRAGLTPEQRAAEDLARAKEDAEIEARHQARLAQIEKQRKDGMNFMLKAFGWTAAGMAACLTALFIAGDRK